MYSRPSYQAPTAEASVLSSIKEFVKLWGSGSQANLPLECNEGKAFIRFSAQLGSPADLHFVPHIPSHGVHDEECPIPRQRGPAQRQRDRARAAAHRAKQQLLENGKPAATAGTESTGSDENPQQGETPAPAVSASPQALPPPTVASAAGPPCLAAPAETPQTPPAAPTTQLKSTEAAPAQTNGAVGIQQMQRVTLNEVQDEVVREESEVKVFATGVFENCPDETLSEDYYFSLRKFVCSLFVCLFKY